MFSGLNKILDRNFIVGFASPSILFLLAFMYISKLFGLLPGYPTWNGKDAFADTTAFAMLGLGGALLLMIFNSTILRISEGYWYRDLGRKVNFFYVKRWRDLNARIADLKAEWATRGDAFGRIRELAGLQELFSLRFPAKERAVLPTKFGNALHAFEDYPRIVYGLDSIPGWIRLTAVIPKDYRESLDEARGDMNFWMNCFFLSHFLLAEYIILAVWSWSMPLVLLVVPTTFLAIVFCSEQATSAAVAWGHWVKGAFDMFLPDMLKKMGYKTPATIAELRELCHNISQMMIFRLEEPLAEMEKYREGGVAPPHVLLPDGKTQ